MAAPSRGDKIWRAAASRVGVPKVLATVEAQVSSAAVEELAEAVPAGGPVKASIAAGVRRAAPASGGVPAGAGVVSAVAEAEVEEEAEAEEADAGKGSVE